jgi:hypothetical protein
MVVWWLWNRKLRAGNAWCWKGGGPKICEHVGMRELRRFCGIRLSRSKSRLRNLDGREDHFPLGYIKIPRFPPLLPPQCSLQSQKPKHNEPVAMASLLCFPKRPRTCYMSPSGVCFDEQYILVTEPYASGEHVEVVFERYVRPGEALVSEDVYKHLFSSVLLSQHPPRLLSTKNWMMDDGCVAVSKRSQQEVMTVSTRKPKRSSLA